jgi:hypothetical protein
MSNDLVINHHPNQLPFTLPNKDIRSSSLRVTNQISLCKMAGLLSAANMLCDFLGPRIARTFLGAALNSIRTSQKSNIFYSKLMMKVEL